MFKFLVICKQADGQGTMFVTTIECKVNDIKEAARIGKDECLSCWERSEEDVIVIGVVSQGLEDLSWNDFNCLTVSDAA